MNKTIVITLALSLWYGGFVSETVNAQAGGRERQAAAEAYDRGTAAYLAHDYARAAQWFETANRMAGAAAALIQAIRSHMYAKNEMRAATLAIQLNDEYPNEPAAVQYANEILGEHEKKFLRIDVSCDRCKVDLNGTLQEYLSFFVEPNTSHTLIAHFDTGDVEKEVLGQAGETQRVVFEPPGEQTERDIGPGESTGPDGSVFPTSERGEQLKDEGKPLSPIFTYIGAGITVGLGVAAIIAAVDMYSGKKEYEDKAAEYQRVVDAQGENSPEAKKIYDEADELLDAGETKEIVTPILIVSTATFAAATGVIALFFTDWSDDEKEERELSTSVAPFSNGAYISLRARF
ncbi:MAG: hypothetical protein JXA30_14540 [Deltaproteobacteria bacterium]|nr:hypothetical protein [Deltaproteobacteria bacterium]